MRKVSRRTFLQSSSAAALSTVALGLPSAWAQTPGTPLPIPAVLNGWRDGQTTVYDLTARHGISELLPGMPTNTLGYNGNVLGPVLRMRRGDAVRLNVTNHLGEPTTCHWHGLHVPAVADGGPHQLIAPGTTWQASFPVRNEAATYWYHPHVEGHTGEQVYNGLAGMIIVDDPALDHLGLPRRYGVDDFPLVVQDRRLSADGHLLYLQTPMDVMWGMLGNQVLVNGALSPTLRAPAQLVRLRLLNGSNARAYNFGFSDNRPFFVIGTDGGLLGAPVPRQRLAMTNGERYEIIVDLSQDAGKTLRLMSYVGVGNPGLPILDIAVDGGIRTESARLPETLRDAPALDAAAVSRTRQFNLQMGMGMMGGMRQGQMMGPGGGMGPGNGMEPGDGAGPGVGMPPSDGAPPFGGTPPGGGMPPGGDTPPFGGTPPGGGAPPGGGTPPGGGMPPGNPPGPGEGMPGPVAGGFTINGVSMDMDVINETVRLGATEEWRISNYSPMAHPFHIHDVQFLVRSRNGAPPPLTERGWKDTVQVRPGETVSILARFSDYADPAHPYMYHCHILEHEDRGMMGQFVVVE